MSFSLAQLDQLISLLDKQSSKISDDSKNQIKIAVSPLELQLVELASRLTTLEGPLTQVEPPQGSQHQLAHLSHPTPLSQEESYWLSRRSLLFSPVTGDDDSSLEANIRSFISKGFDIQDNFVASINFSYSRVLTSNGVSPCVKVTFEDISTLDCLLYKVSALSDGMFVKIDVPDYLRPLFRKLQQKSYEIRHVPDMGGSPTKTSIRFHDKSLSLRLWFKTTADVKWKVFNVLSL